jgi:CheY-like chemotaxis protein
MDASLGPRYYRAMADPRSAGLFASLRAAAHVSQERFLVGMGNARERARVAEALGAEGTVTAPDSVEEALHQLAEESFEIAVFDVDPGEGQRNPATVARELRPFTDLIFVADGDPVRCTELFAREAAAVLPRPLPASDALLRAHVRWLASCRRSRTRGLLLGNALKRHRDELRDLEPALEGALSGIVHEAAQDPTVMVIGDGELLKIAGGTAAETAPDVVVVGVGAADNLTTRMHEARGRAPGAALVLVDGASTPERLAAALYGGARGYLERTLLPQLGRVVACTAVRRRGEVTGRRMVETLARFSVLDEQDRQAPATPRDLDARLIADATAIGGQFVPSGHEVLVVDDEVVVLTVLREALRRGGYRVTTAASAEEAIDLMRKRRFDLVLTDKNLPGASGLEVLRVARTLDPAPAVVLITGYSSYDSAVEALDIGAQDYIEKPIRDVEQLRYRIRRALSRRDEQMSRARAAPPGESTGRVLVVEVEGTRRQLIAEFLGRSYHVTAAANGDEALALLQKERYDVVLADRNLPGMSGLRVIEQAQRLLPHCASVLYTAYPSYDSVKEAFDLGVDAYLVRPSEDLKKLAEKVAGALQGRGGILLG